MSQTPSQTTTPEQAAQPAPAAPAPAPAPAVATPPAPDTVTVSRAEYEQSQRAANQYKGAEPLIQQMVQSGLKTPEDIAEAVRLRELNSTLSNSGLAPDKLAELLAGKNPGTTGTPTNESLSLDQIREAFRGEITSHTVMQEHERQSALDLRGVEGITSEATQHITDPVQKELVTAYIDKITDESRQLYPVGHPLRDQQYMPLDEAGLAAVKQKAMAAVAAATGQQIINTAQSGGNGAPAVPGTLGANGAINGANPTLGDAKIPFMKRTMAEKIAAYQAIEQRNSPGGLPISQATT